MDTSSSNNNRLIYCAKIFLVFIVYFLAAKLGLMAGATSGYTTLIWPPTGVALAILFLYGRALWPGIYLGGILFHFTSGGHVVSGLGIGLGNTLEALVGASLLQRQVDFHKSLDRVKDVVTFIALAALCSTLISAVIGVVSLWLSGADFPEGIITTGQVWWIQNVLSDLVVAPFIFIWVNRVPQPFKIFRNPESILLPVSLIVISYFVFGTFTWGVGDLHHLPLYVLIPFVMWAALRFEQRGNVASLFVIFVMAVWSTARDLGPFNHHGTPNANLFLLQSFVSTMAVTGLLLAASVTEWKRAIEERRIAQAALQKALAQADFLARASKILSASLDYEESLNNLAQLAVTQIADWCAINIVGEEGRNLKRLIVTHRDPYYLKRAKELETNFFLDQNASSGNPNVIRTGISEFYPNMTEELINNIYPNSEQRDLVREIGIKSMMIVPIISRGKIFGTICIMASEPTRTYTFHDLVLAEELARRAGAAIDNALLYKEAQKAIKGRDEFLSIASHELKTPLTSLSLQIQMARKKIQPELNLAPPPEKLAKVFEISYKQVSRLAGLVDDLLDTARIQTGKFRFNFEQTNLSDVITDMVGRYSEELVRAKCSMISDIQENIVGYFDHVRIEQVIDNLLSNALKYAPGQPVKVSLSVNEGIVRLTVEDHGPGIPEEKRAKLFSRYGRVTDSKSIGGMGLGLFIVKEIVNGHKGSVRLESKSEMGSEFIIELPIDGIKTRRKTSEEISTQL